MVIKCLECSDKCGLPFNLAFQYSIYHEDTISKCACVDKTLSGICIKELVQQSCFANFPMKTDCSFEDEYGYNSSSSINYNSNSNSKSSSNYNSNSSSNSNSKPNSNSNSSSSINSNSNSNYNSNSNFNFNTKGLTRNYNKCNSVKSLTDFDESKYTCRNCTSAKVNCLYCTSVVRYDGIRAHVKKQHPDVELTRGFSRNLSPRRTITQTGESCSCKFYNFVSFFIIIGINIEKAKENKSLLKSIDKFK